MGRNHSLGAYASKHIIGLLLLPFFFACSQNTPIRAPDNSVRPLPDAGPTQYRLQRGDLITVKFWANPDLDEEVLVRPDGFISLQFVDEVRAAGRTPSELDAELTRLYSPELTNPSITVILRSLAGNRVFVSGEVGDPTAVDLSGRMTLMQAITEAGYFLTSARRKQVLVIRTTEDGRRVAAMIDTRPIISGEDLDGDIFMQPGDLIVVPRSKIVSVAEFVNRYFYDLLPIDIYFSYRLLQDRSDS